MENGDSCHNSLILSRFRKDNIFFIKTSIGEPECDPGAKLFGLTIFDCIDKLCSDWLLPLGGLLFTLFVGWYMSKADVRDEFTNHGTANTAVFNLVWFLMRYIAPVGILVVFITNLVM